MPRPRSVIRRKLPRELTTITGPLLPAFLDKNQKAAWRILEFFTARIRNPNTRSAYAQAVGQFARHCTKQQITLEKVSPFIVADYIEGLGKRLAPPSVKQHLAAIRMLFDFLVTGQIVPVNPATSVRGPKHVVKKGLTPVLSVTEARELFDAIDATTIGALRDRALIAVMVFSFARIGAVAAMNVEDYFPQGKRMWLRLHEKGGKLHDVPAHRKVEALIDAYMERAGLNGQKRVPLFQTMNRHGQLTGRRMHRLEALAMVKRRARQAGLSSATCCHSFRATGITAYLENGGTLEHAQQIASHESPRTTKLYDRTRDAINLDEIERIAI